MLKLTVYLIAAVALLGCDRNLQFSNTDTTKPGINCIVQPEQFNVPELVQQDQRFSLSFNRQDVHWKLTNGFKDLTFEGSQVEVSIDEIGIYLGTVTGKNNCNKLEAREFQISVVEKVEGLGLVINNNDVYTNNKNVNLALSAIGATEMYITNTPNCSSGGVWVPFQPAKTWTLGQLNKKSQVYAKFKNAVIETPCISDDIIHDDIAPALRFVSAPAHLVNTQTANFEFAVEDTGSGVKSFFCRIDGAPFQVCPLVKSYTNLSQGLHTVSIYAQDKAGNKSGVLDHVWEIDTVAPTIQITQTPSNPSNTKNASFSFVGQDQGVAISDFDCSLDGANFQSCTSPKAYQVSEGAHTFRVRGKDKAGNVSATASYSWEVDSIAPTIQITQAPTLLTKDNFAHFEFVAQDSGLGLASVKCQLVGQPQVNCVNSMDYDSLANGTYTFRVTAQDKAGNSKVASHTWEVNDKITDQVIPVVEQGGATDILFLTNVVTSMYNTYRNKTDNQFRKFVNTLGTIDYRIGVVTGDYRDGASSYREGRVVPVEKGNSLKDEFMLTPTSTNLLNKFLSTISRREVTCAYGTWTGPNGSFCGASGWNLPVSNQILRAGQRALDHADNQGFFRDEASLNVVMISNTDEICQSGMKGADGVCLPQDTLHSPEAFINKVQSAFPNKTLKVHALVHRRGDTGCDFGPSAIGHNYIKLAQMTGGSVQSVCRDHSSEGEAIARAISSTSHQAFTLNCEPGDMNKDGVVDEKDISFTLTPAMSPTPQLILSGQSIQFQPTLPAGTQISLRYVCK